MSTGELSEGEIVDSDGEQVLDPSQRPVDGLEDVFFFWRCSENKP